jgi:hypothetical protein
MKMKMMKNVFVIVERKKLVISKEKLSFAVWREDLIEKAIVKFDGEWVTVSGKLRNYEYNSDLRPIKDFETIDKSEIKVRKNVWKREVEYVEDGWVLLKKRKPYVRRFCKFAIEVVDKC